MTGIIVPMVLEHGAEAPSIATGGAAGFDLRSTQQLTLTPWQRALVKTGVRLAIPRGLVGKVCPRSGLAVKHGITVLNAPGVIDSDFTGEIGVVLINLGGEDFNIYPDDRIAQLVIEKLPPIVLRETDQLDDTERGEGGFGSTG